MFTKLWSSSFLPIAVFVMATVIVYFAITQWRGSEPEKKRQQDTIEGVQGLSPGELVNLPALSSMSGETIFLDRFKEKQVLCVFFTPSCSGCAKDVELWRDLNDEAAKKGVAFFIIDVGDDRSALDQFVETYKLGALPVLFDPDHKVGPALKINLVPQYLLFAGNGRVLRRWDGIRRYDRSSGQQQLGEFFQPHGDLP